MKNFTGEGKPPCPHTLHAVRYRLIRVREAIERASGGNIPKDNMRALMSEIEMILTEFDERDA